MIRYTEQISLVGRTYSQDAVGNVTATETERIVLAKLNNVSIKEFYSGIEAGITPTYEFQLRKSNYNGEVEIKYKNNVYHLIRVIEKTRMDIVLVVEKKAGDL